MHWITSILLRFDRLVMGCFLCSTQITLIWLENGDKDELQSILRISSCKIRIQTVAPPECGNYIPYNLFLMYTISRFSIAYRIFLIAPFETIYLSHKKF